MTDPVPFTLTDAERNSPIWHRLVGHLTDRLHLLRARNDGRLNEYETATLRGQISELKTLIALGDEPLPQGEE